MKDPKTGKFEVTTGNNIPQLGQVKFRSKTLLGNSRRTLQVRELSHIALLSCTHPPPPLLRYAISCQIPYASQKPEVMGDVAGELIDLAEEELEIEKIDSEQGQGEAKGQEEEGGDDDLLQNESSLSSLESTDGFGAEAESSTESLELDPNSMLEDTGGNLLESQEGGYEDATGEHMQPDKNHVHCCPTLLTRKPNPTLTQLYEP